MLIFQAEFSMLQERAGKARFAEQSILLLRIHTKKTLQRNPLHRPQDNKIPLDIKTIENSK